MVGVPTPGDKPGDTYAPNWPEEDADPNLTAIDLAQSLMDQREFEELEQLAKVQVLMDPQNAPEWRAIGKKAAKARRRQRPWIVRVLLTLLKIVGGLVILFIVIAIIGALAHH